MKLIYTTPKAILIVKKRPIYILSSNIVEDNLNITPRPNKSSYTKKLLEKSRNKEEIINKVAS